MLEQYFIIDDVNEQTPSEYYKSLNIFVYT